MIQVGYATETEDILHETVDNAVAANVSIESLRSLKANDASIMHFYLSMRTYESDYTEWEKYAFVDPL